MEQYLKVFYLLIYINKLENMLLEATEAIEKSTTTLKETNTELDKYKFIIESWEKNFIVFN